MPFTFCFEWVYSLKVDLVDSHIHYSQIEIKLANNGGKQSFRAVVLDWNIRNSVCAQSIQDLHQVCSGRVEY